MVTVTSATQAPPKSLYPLWQCGSSSDGFVTLGCVTRDLVSADGLSFTWKDPSGKALTDVIQYPAVQASGGYTAVSQARVKASDWEQSLLFTCEAKNGLGKLEKQLKKQVVPELPASLLLTTPTQAELENGTATFVCLASQFSPKTHSFKWTLGSTDLSKRVKDTILSQDKVGFTAISVLEIKASEWTGSSSPVKCQFEQQKNPAIHKEAKYEASDAIKEAEMSIIPPSPTDMLINRVGRLGCKTDKDKHFKNITWLNSRSEVIAPDDEKTDGTTVTLFIRISFEEWSNGTKFTCEVKNSAFIQQYKTEDYQRETDRKKLPEVFLIAPPESNSNTVTLTCYVKHFYPKEVAVSWLVDDKSVDSPVYEQNTTTVIERNDLYSVYSQLAFPRDNWESGSVFSCRVYHESIEKPVLLISRSITNNNPSSNPTLLNLNLSVPPACYSF